MKQLFLLTLSGALAIAVPLYAQTGGTAGSMGRSGASDSMGTGSSGSMGTTGASGSTMGSGTGSITGGTAGHDERNAGSDPESRLDVRKWNEFRNRQRRRNRRLDGQQRWNDFG
jgi:hypothetical protein